MRTRDPSFAIEGKFCMSLRILNYNVLAGGEDRLPLIGRVIQQHRVAEMQAILRLLHPHRNQLQVLVGDLNTIHPADHPNVAAYLMVLVIALNDRTKILG